MSRGMGVQCPKCSQYTENEETCDVCGANIARILARQSGDEFGFDTADKKIAALEEYDNERKINPLMLILIVAGVGLAIWMNVDFYMMKKSSEAEDRARVEREKADEAGPVTAAVPATAPTVEGPEAAAAPSTATAATFIEDAARKREQERKRAEDVERAQQEARQMIRGLQSDVPEKARAR